MLQRDHDMTNVAYKLSYVAIVFGLSLFFISMLIQIATLPQDSGDKIAMAMWANFVIENNLVEILFVGIVIAFSGVFGTQVFEPNSGQKMGATSPCPFSVTTWIPGREIRYKEVDNDS